MSISKEHSIKKETNNSIWLSALINTALFIIFLSFCKPVLDSDDNFFILYTLGGGYGNKPTNLLHYYYEWHPILFWPIARLFYYFPYFNWYTGFLLLLQWSSCINLLYLFFLFLRKTYASLLFLLFFLFFESRFLLSLNDSNTSFILAISGCSSLLYYFLKNPVPPHYKELLPSALLILIGGLLRVHTTALYLVLSLGMGLFILPLHQYRKFAGVLFLTGTVLLASVEGHKYFYEAKIPNMKEEEEFRQSLFYLANHPANPDNTDTGISAVRNSFIRSWFLYDTSFVQQKDIKAFTQSTVQNRLKYTRGNAQVLYWTFINSRVYLLFISILLFYFISLKHTGVLRRWLLMSSPAVLIYLYLALFMKITDGIFLTLLCSMFMSAVFCIHKKKLKISPISRVILFILVLNTAWMLIRIIKVNESNRFTMQQTRNLLKEIGTHPEFLFVNTDGKFNDKGFSIWDTPKQYPLKNLLNNELLINRSYKGVLQRYQINDLMEELPKRTDIILFNSVEPLLKEYYQIHKGIDVEVKKVEGFTFINAYRVRRLTGKDFKSFENF